MSIFREISVLRLSRLWIPAGAILTGPLEADSSAYIDGTVKGDIIISGKLILGTNAIIFGNVHAAHLLHYGKIYGHVICSGKAVLKNKSYIKGHLISTTSKIKENAIIDGGILNNENTNKRFPDDEGAAIPTHVATTDTRETWF